MTPAYHGDSKETIISMFRDLADMLERGDLTIHAGNISAVPRVLFHKGFLAPSTFGVEVKSDLILLHNCEVK